MHHLTAFLTLRHLLRSRVRRERIAPRDHGDRCYSDGSAKLGREKVDMIESELWLARRDLIKGAVVDGAASRRLVERRDVVEELARIARGPGS